MTLMVAQVVAAGIGDAQASPDMANFVAAEHGLGGVSGKCEVTERAVLTGHATEICQTQQISHNGNGVWHIILVFVVSCGCFCCSCWSLCCWG